MQQERLIYLSRVRPGVGDVEIRQLGGAAEVLHRRADLTGLLAYTGAHFFQVIEGKAAEIGRVMAQIEADHRHGSMRVLCRQPTATRHYDGWRFLFLDSLDLADEVEAMLQAEDVSAQQAEDLACRLYRYARHEG